MTNGRARISTAIAGLAVVLTAAVGMMTGPAGAAAELVDDPVIVEVGSATGPVGQPAQLVASLKIKEGYAFIDPRPRGNRVIELSSEDEGVKFAKRVFRGQLEDNALTFTLDVTPTRPGTHAINGLFRVGYVVHTDTEHKLMQVSIPLISTVVGTE